MDWLNPLFASLERYLGVQSPSPSFGPIDRERAGLIEQAKEYFRSATL